MRQLADVVVVGAGIAGLAVGAVLACDRRVVVLETAGQAATQATARSASSWIVGYGRPTVAPFTRASRTWFEGQDERRSGRSLLRRRGLLLVVMTGDAPVVDTLEATGLERVDAKAAQRLFPALRPEAIAAAARDPDTYDIDTMGAVDDFRDELARGAGELVTGAPATTICRVGGSWRIGTPAGTFETGLIVNAAGAWADAVAESAGLPPLGLVALRRTACTFVATSTGDAADWPLLMDAAERFYVKPHGAGVFLASPADETPQPPADAMPDPVDVALAIDRVRAATTLEPRAVTASWAGLRTFAPDRAPVLGLDPASAGFAWYAGLGGSGVMAAPAMARSVVRLIDAGDLPADVVAAGGDAARLLPDRLRLVASEPP